MARLIDVNTVKTIITGGTDRAAEGMQLIYIECMQKIKQAVIEFVEKIPEVEVVPKKYHEDCLALANERFTAQMPKHGRLIETQEGTFCSECDKNPLEVGEYHVANYHAAYCPHCGAKMDGGEDDAQE